MHDAMPISFAFQVHRRVPLVLSLSQRSAQDLLAQSSSRTAPRLQPTVLRPSRRRLVAATVVQRGQSIRSRRHRLLLQPRLEQSKRSLTHLPPLVDLLQLLHPIRSSRLLEPAHLLHAPSSAAVARSLGLRVTFISTGVLGQRQSPVADRPSQVAVRRSPQADDQSLATAQTRPTLRADDGDDRRAVSRGVDAVRVHRGAEHDRAERVRRAQSVSADVLRSRRETVTHP